MIKTRFRYVVPVVLVLSLAGASLAVAGNQGGPKSGKHWGSSSWTGATLSGRQEAPPIRTAGKGALTLKMTNSTTFSYELTFTGLKGNVTAAHLHFGQPGVNGGVLVDLCGGTKPACPAATAGTVTGTIMPVDIKLLAAQGFEAGDWAGFLEELKAGMLYANVHTTSFGGGEIRGQVGSKHHGRGFDHWFKDKDDD